MSGSVWGKKAVITFIIKYEFNPRYDLTLSVCNNPPQTLIFSISAALLSFLTG